MRKRHQTLRLLYFLLLPMFLSSCGTIEEQRVADRIAQRGNKIEAIKYYEAALLKNSRESRAKEIRTQIDALRRDVTSEALFSAEKAKDDMPTLPGLTRAISILEENLPYDDYDKRIASSLTSYKSLLAGVKAKIQQKLNEAGELVKSKSWAKAIAALKDALALDPGNRKLDLDIVAQISARDVYYSDSIRRAIREKNIPDASARLDAFQEEVPTPKANTLKEITGEVMAMKEMVVTENAEELIQKNKFYSACKLLEQSQKESSRARLQEIQAKGATYYFQKAKEDWSAGVKRLGYAYFAVVKALELNPHDSAIFAFHRDISDIIDKHINIKIAISGFDSSSKAPDAGPQLSDALIAYLVDFLPYGIQILERSKIDSLLRERGRELKELSEELKVEMFIVGNVSTLEVEHQRSEREVTEMVQTGTKRELNLAYDDMMRTYGPDLRKWPSSVARYIEVPTREMVKYKTGSEKVNGLMIVSVRIFETSKASITVAKEFKETEKAKDDFRDAVPMARITVKPLDLPTDNEIKEKLRTRLVKRVADLIIKSYEARERRFWDQAQWLLERREVDKAVLRLAYGHYYCNMDKENLKGNKNNEVFAKLREAGLLKYTE